MASNQHKPDIVLWSEAKQALEAPSEDFSLDPTFYDYHILAEGDSWITMGGFPPSNLLHSLRFDKITMIVNCGRPGDDIKKISNVEENLTFQDALSNQDIFWDFIFLSAGGNDVFDNLSKIIKTKTQLQATPITEISDYCHLSVFKEVIESIQQGFKRLVAMRDANTSSAKNRPIIVHTYDYVTPRNAPAKFLMVKKGPWIYKTFIESDIPEAAWVELAKFILNQLAEGIIELGQGRPKALPNFHVVDTRDSLTPAELDTKGVSNDWLNEIHPDSEGYVKIANAINIKKQEVFS